MILGSWSDKIFGGEGVERVLLSPSANLSALRSKRKRHLAGGLSWGPDKKKKIFVYLAHVFVFNPNMISLIIFLL